MLTPLPDADVGADEFTPMPLAGNNLVAITRMEEWHMLTTFLNCLEPISYPSASLRCDRSGQQTRFVVRLTRASTPDA